MSPSVWKWIIGAMFFITCLTLLLKSILGRKGKGSWWITTLEAGIVYAFVLPSWFLILRIESPLWGAVAILLIVFPLFCLSVKINDKIDKWAKKKGWLEYTEYDELLNEPTDSNGDSDDRPGPSTSLGVKR